MKVQPLHDNILILRVESVEKTAGGIIIPDAAKEKPQEGKIVAVGSGRVNKKGERIPMDVKVGDRVLFGRYAGMEMKVDGVEHVFMREDEILCIVE